MVMKKYAAGTAKWAKPLAMPVFGVPFNGQQCPACRLWFDRRHFARRSGWVKRCRECVATGPQANAE